MNIEFLEKYSDLKLELYKKQQEVEDLKKNLKECVEVDKVRNLVSLSIDEESMFIYQSNFEEMCKLLKIERVNNEK